MKLQELELPTTTQLKVVDQFTGEPNGVVITGYTPDSKEWRKAQRAVAGNANTTTAVEIGKKGHNRIQIPNDPKAYEKRIRLLASVVTNITGIDDWAYSDTATMELFSNDGCAWLVEQWEDHLEERKNFLKPAETPAKRGSKPLAG